MARTISSRPRPRKGRTLPPISPRAATTYRASAPSEQAYEFKLARVCEVGESRSVGSPEEAVAYWREVIEERSWFQPNREHVVTLLLNSRRHLTGHHLVSIGTLNESMAHPRDILGPVLCGAAYGFILMHNHPSGLPDPSAADTALTRLVREAGELIRIELTDHVIVGAEGRYFSYREAGLI